MNSNNHRGGPRRQFSSGPRPFRRGRPPVRRGKSVPGAQYIDPSKFVNKVTVTTEEVAEYKPEHAFTDFKIDDKLKKVIIDRGYKLPTPIQDRTIPHILGGADVVGIANTGTGKTAAFLIPLIDRVLHDKNHQTLIVCPTRELAQQIEQELKKFTTGMKIFSVSCVGGSNIGYQLRQLRLHNSFIIGTPGRLKDLIERKAINLAKFSAIVLDEADRMLDMGFINDMKLIMAGMPAARQTLFFSATLSPEIERLVGQFLKNPVRISVKTRDTAKSVDQDVVRIARNTNKLDILRDLLRTEGYTKILVFGRTKHGVERLSRELASHGFRAESIHGNKNQAQRQRALKAFKDDHVNVLVATDVAARGLDIPDVSHVINYDIPATYEDYVHRIGRTGRGNKTGKALTFVEA